MRQGVPRQFRDRLITVAYKETLSQEQGVPGQLLLTMAYREVDALVLAYIIPAWIIL